MIQALFLLRGLKSLLLFYCPAVLKLGVLVRNCTWAGRENGTSRYALESLRRSLFLLIGLLGYKKAATTKYCCTISIALLMWQPWYSKLPGCAFAEESCEALLSRMARRCRENTHYFAFEDVFDLFLTVPNVRFGFKDRAGGLRQELIQIVRSRLRKLIDRANTMPFGGLEPGGRIGKGSPPVKFVATFPEVPLPEPLTEITPLQLRDILYDSLFKLTGPLILPDFSPFVRNSARIPRIHTLVCLPLWGLMVRVGSKKVRGACLSDWSPYLDCSGNRLQKSRPGRMPWRS